MQDEPASIVAHCSPPPLPASPALVELTLHPIGEQASARHTKTLAESARIDSPLLREDPPAAAHVPMRGGLALTAGRSQSDEASPPPELLPLLLPASVPPSVPPELLPELLPLLEAEPLLDPLLDAEPLLDPLSSPPPPSVAPELLPVAGPPDDDELQPPTAVNPPSAKVSPAIARTCNFMFFPFPIPSAVCPRRARHNAARPFLCAILARLSSF
jgi:hypothetical protein